MFHADFDIMLQTLIGLVHDLIHRNRTRLRAGIGFLEACQILPDFGQPGIQHLGRTRIQRGKGTDNAGLALRLDQFRAAGDEHRRGNHRQLQVLQDGGQMGCTHEASLGGSHSATFFTRLLHPAYEAKLPRILLTGLPLTLFFS